EPQWFVVAGKEVRERPAAGKIDPAHVVAADVIAKLPCVAATDAGAAQLTFLPPFHQALAQRSELRRSHETRADRVSASCACSGNDRAGGFGIQGCAPWHSRGARSLSLSREKRDAV